jgi:rhodanese-related sulfurtransferase
MSKKYVIPVALLLILGLVLVLLPQRDHETDAQPGELLAELSTKLRFLNPDLVAQRMVDGDPSLLLIDVRNTSEYERFTLPGAVNIPLDSILSDNSKEIIGQEGIDAVFFSNDNIIAGRAWILSKRAGADNIFILEGGLDLWFRNFFTAVPPPETASASEIELHQFRMGVRQHFTGGSITISSPEPSGEPLQLKPKSKKSAAEGGC